jgi:hypothetical protein
MMHRGSSRLLLEERDRARTYEKVAVVYADGSSILDCGHYSEASKRNPAELGQTRYCGTCTDAKTPKELLR